MEYQPERESPSRQVGGSSSCYVILGADEDEEEVEEGM